MKGCGSGNYTRHAAWQLANTRRLAQLAEAQRERAARPQYALPPKWHFTTAGRTLQGDELAARKRELERQRATAPAPTRRARRRPPETPHDWHM